MTTSTRVSLADLADATGIVLDLLAAEVRAIQHASVISGEPLPLPASRGPSVLSATSGSKESLRKLLGL